ncbi:hypothetical protein ACP4OV_013010 [Aristida adscensionis]
MDRQSLQGGGAGGHAMAMQEYLYATAGGGGQPEQQVVLDVDGAFLMELLEDAPAAEQQPEDVDRLSRVIRSLEAEIGADGMAAAAAASIAPASEGYGESSAAEHAPRDVDGGGLEDMLLELDGIPGLGAGDAPFEYWAWADAAPAPAGHEHDMGGWYVDGDAGVVVGHEFRDQCYYGYGEIPAVEPVYCPLWE